MVYIINYNLTPIFLDYFSYQPKKKCKCNANKNHGGYWHVKRKVFFLYFNIARKISEPVQLITEKPYYQSDNYYNDPDDYNCFSC